MIISMAYKPWLTLEPPGEFFKSACSSLVVGGWTWRSPGVLHPDATTSLRRHWCGEAGLDSSGGRCHGMDRGHRSAVPAWGRPRGITAKGNLTGRWIPKEKWLSSTAEENLGVEWMLDSGLEHVVLRMWLWRRMSLLACETVFRGEVFRGEPSVSAHGKLRQAANMEEVK